MTCSDEVRFPFVRSTRPQARPGDSRPIRIGFRGQGHLLLREILGPIRLVPEETPSGKRYYRAETRIQTLNLLEGEPEDEGGGPSGSSS
jgi:hypothetical protein